MILRLEPRFSLFYDEHDELARQSSFGPSPERVELAFGNMGDVQVYNRVNRLIVKIVVQDNDEQTKF